MKTFGLESEEVSTIKKLFNKHFGDLKEAKIFLYGSRSTGNHKKYSDIDFAIKASKKVNLEDRISNFKSDWENSSLPYQVDLINWLNIYKPYLPEIKKQKIPFWEPEEKKVHPWRVCPYGQHWVKRHDRLKKTKIQDVDGHCRKNKSKKDCFGSDEILFISSLLDFKNSTPKPSLYPDGQKNKLANNYDNEIAGWCKYWNEVFKPDLLIEPNFVKALIESESTFNPNATAKNKKSVGLARGLVQITEQTLRILKDRSGEIKEFYVDLEKEDLFDPSKNICAAIRWLFRKREILLKRLNRSVQWYEVIAEYKGVGPELKKNGPKSKKVIDDFNFYYGKYK